MRKQRKNIYENEERKKNIRNKIVHLREKEMTRRRKKRTAVNDEGGSSGGGGEGGGGDAVHVCATLPSGPLRSLTWGCTESPPQFPA